MEGFDDILNKFNFVPTSKKELSSSIGTMPCLGLNAIPYFGQYGVEYDWMTPCMTFRCLPKDRDQRRQFVYHLVPFNHLEWADSKGQMNQRANLMADDSEFYLVNYNAVDFCTKRLEDYGEKSVMARINLAVHPFVFPRAIIGEEIKEEVVEVVYVTE
jgi:hypothetical protein